jgi:hypothetical protein
MEPTSFTIANQDLRWWQAMYSEFNALIKNGTWVLVPIADHHVIECKWIYKVKRRSDGCLECYKACLIAKGFSEQEGVDYFETFNPVVKPTTIHIILALAT